MPHVEINNASIYYREYGEDQPDQAPIVLIHGATNDSQNDWGSIAPELARRYRVFTPDCRGHGRSSNPRMSYSFGELAGDVAAFVRTVGYERAHIIGHSNGGNVALVTLLEHPEVVQSAVLQAANAYVTRYLVEREPKVFDPERMAHEAPEWLHEVKSLHNEVHGLEYWRDLLWLTMCEIISEPNYSPAELRRVERPTLVIMGRRTRSTHRMSTPTISPTISRAPNCGSLRGQATMYTMSDPRNGSPECSISWREEDRDCRERQPPFPAITK